MEKNLFREVYRQVCGLALKDCPPSSLSGLLHGYLSVYSMVRVYPWLEDEYGSLWDIHDRIREIARVIQELLTDKDHPMNQNDPDLFPTKWSFTYPLFLRQIIFYS